MTAEHVQPFAEQLKQYRRGQGLTQEELAERAGLSPRGIRALEQGERTNPHRDTVRLLSRALGLDGDKATAFARAASGTRAVSRGEAQGEPKGGFLGATPAGPMVARANELRHLVKALDTVRHGAGRTVMLSGEPGIGKTRLAQEVTVAARARGFLVASGRCYEPERAVPYYPFLSAISAVFDRAPDQVRAHVPEKWPYVEWLLPRHAPSTGTGDLGAPDVQQRMFWALSGFLAAVAETEPVALMLDDLHWADESSLKLLRHVALQTRGNRVLLLGTYRDTEARRQSPLQSTLHHLTRDGLLDEIGLRRLERAETGQLAATVLGRDVPDEIAGIVHSRTDGNPFFTQEVLRALLERGAVLARGDTWDTQAMEGIDVPRSVRAAIDERVSRLSPLAQAILQEASVLGQVFNFDNLARMSRHTNDEVEEALDEALQAMLLRVVTGDTYGFSHALTQQALSDELTPRKRARVHAAVGEALAEQPEAVRRRQASQIAWHFMQAHRPEQALPFAILAGDESEAVFAHSEAERHYRTAIDLARSLDERHQEAEVLEKLGMVLRLMARYDEALAMLERRVQIYANLGDIEGEARVLGQMVGAVYHHLGKPEEGVERAAAMIGRLVQSGTAVESSSALADLYTGLGMNLWGLARYSETLAATQKAAELARAAGYTRPLALAETFRGMALTMAGPLPEARRVLEGAIALSPVSEDTWWMANALGNTGRAYLDEGDFRMARDYLERSREVSDAWHEGAELAWAESNIGETAFLSGRWAEARTWYESAARAAREVGSPRYLSYTLLHLAELCIAEGKWDEAEGYITEGCTLAEASQTIPTLRKAARLYAEKDLRAQRPGDAVERMGPWLNIAPEDEPRCFPPPVLAEAFAAQGDFADAEGLVTRRIARFRAQHHRRALTEWLRVQALILRDQGRWDEAEHACLEALALTRHIGYPYAEVRILHEYAQLHRDIGDEDSARQREDEARAILKQLGARAEPAAS